MGGIEQNSAARFLVDRLDSIQANLGRCRRAFIAQTFIAATIIVALWNTYLAWDRFLLEDAPTIQTQIDSELEKEARTWHARMYVDSRGIQLGLIGIRISSSDLAALGSSALWLAAVFLTLSLRRGNHDVAIVLMEALEQPAQIQRHIYFVLRPEFVYSSPAEEDHVFKKLDDAISDGSSESLRPSLRILHFLPAVTILFIIGSDIFYALDPHGSYEFGLGHRPWDVISSGAKTELLFFDALAAFFFALVLRYNWRSFAYSQGMCTMMVKFKKQYLEQHNTSIHRPLPILDPKDGGRTN